MDVILHSSIVIVDCCPISLFFFFFWITTYLNFFQNFFRGQLVAIEYFVWPSSTIILFIYCSRMVERCSLLSQSLTAESIGLAEGLSGWMMITTTHPIEVDRSFLSFYSYEKTNNENFDAQNAAGNWRMVNIESNWLNYCASICIYTSISKECQSYFRFFFSLLHSFFFSMHLRVHFEFIIQFCGNWKLCVSLNR